MAKKIAFPISKDKRIKSLPVAFPERCVICGREKQNTLPVTLEQKQIRGNKTFSLPLGLIQVPYCEEHSKEIESSEEQTEKVQGSVFNATFLLLVIPLFWTLYSPIYDWSADDLIDRWGRLPGSVGSFIVAVMAILMLDLIIAVAVGLTVAGVKRWLSRAPVREIVSSVPGFVLFEIGSDEVATEFLRMNEDLGAIESSFGMFFDQRKEEPSPEPQEKISVKDEVEMPAETAPTAAEKIEPAQKVEAAAGQLAPASTEPSDSEMPTSTGISTRPNRTMGCLLTTGSLLILALGISIAAAGVVGLADSADAANDLLGSVGKLAICTLPIFLIGSVLLVVGIKAIRRKVTLPAAGPIDSKPASARKPPDKRRGRPSASMVWLNICIQQHNVPGMLNALNHKNWIIREGAAKALGEYKEVRAVEPLILALKDEDSDVRGNAVTALGNIGDSRAVGPLIQALKDKDGVVRRRAAYALGKFGDPGAVAPMIQALNDKDWVVRGNAADVLGGMGDPRAVEPLIQALSDEEAETVYNVALALGKLGDARAAEPLVQVLSHEDETARIKAALALGSMGDARGVEILIQALLTGDPTTRREAAKALGNTGDAAAVDTLIQALKDPDQLVRRGAARALGAIGDARAVEPLTQMLEKGQLTKTQEAAEEALRQIKASSRARTSPPGKGQS